MSAERDICMAYSATASHGMVVAPHHLAADSGAAVLRDGGSAIEAMVAAAATIAVVYPHMTGLGGDGFWLIYEPGQMPVAIDASGAAGLRVTPDLYASEHDGGAAVIPARGPLAANTVAGTVSGWALALAHDRRQVGPGSGSGAAANGDVGGARLPLARLLADAIALAETGFPVSAGQARLAAEKRAELQAVSGFAQAFLQGGEGPEAGENFCQPALAATLRRLAEAGLDDFYGGDLGREIAAGLERAGSPLSADDLARHRARFVPPLSVDLSVGRIYNLPPPTQGMASLMILGLFDRLGVREADGFAHVHGLVEATKSAFRLRDRHLGDPGRVTKEPQDLLSGPALDRLVSGISRDRAAPWPHPAAPGDTVWMGAVDRQGRAVSFIQSLYWEFGSGVVLPETGITWQNRGSAFVLDPSAPRALAPGRRPFHTLNPALARLRDGRVIAYGTMGGDGQPQTQAAILTRAAWFGQPLEQTVSAPRWLLGRTWGDDTTSLRLEGRFPLGVVGALRAAGHAVDLVEPFSQAMGHAGAVALHADGTIEGAADPRSDGAAVGV